MLEDDLRTLFRLQANGDLPASAVSVPAAGRRARALRRRRAVAIASPVLAAAAVLAVVASGTLLGTSGTGSGARSAPGPRYLDATLSYASFGWLPGGAITGEHGGTSRTEMWLDAGTRSSDLSLYVYSAGQCGLRTSARSHRAELNCTGGIGSTGQPAPVTSRAADVHGHRAYVVTLGGAVLAPNMQADNFLAWQYASNSWALLEYHSMSRALAARAADHATVGVPTGSIRFPAQLTGVPSDWQVSDTAFTLQAGVLAASDYQVTVGPLRLPLAGGGYPPNMPNIAVGPPQAVNACIIGRVPLTRRVINGYQVTIQDVSGRTPPQQQLCAADADGLAIAMYVLGSHPVMSVAAIFGHMRLLGPNPANWTARPVG